MQNKDIKNELIINLIFDVVEEHNKINPEELKLEKSLQTELAGMNGSLDSLGLINFLVEVESNFNQKFENNISIIDELLLLEQDGPYKNIENLSQYIISKIK